MVMPFTTFFFKFLHAEPFLASKGWSNFLYIYCLLRAVKFEKIKYNIDKSHRQYPQDSQLRQDYLKPSCKLNVITLQMIGQFP